MTDETLTPPNPWSFFSNQNPNEEESVDLSSIFLIEIPQESLSISLLNGLRHSCNHTSSYLLHFLEELRL